jgi:hypothetical protein
MMLARMTDKHLLATLAVVSAGLTLMLAGGVAARPSHCRQD